MVAIRSAAIIPRQAVSELWWLLMVEAILAIFFGIVAIFWPALTLLTLVYLFSAFVLGWGLLEILTGVMSIRRRDTWWLTLLFGLIALGVGIFLVRHPAVSFATFILVIGLTLIARGLFDIVSIFLDKLSFAHRAIRGILGIAAIAAGIIILLQPVAGGVAFVWVLGLYALIFGPLTLVLALESRNDFLGLTEAAGGERKEKE
ncbi:MAG: hypothetical protein JWL89_327 [Candidatus Saccharibacteria bacterium]|nr:hypothetical protein [Candidatus Saccharibacteria bacterium]